MTSLTDKAVETFANDLYATRLTGAKVERVELRHAQCTLTLQPDHRNAMGAVMGGVLFTLADLAFAAAANSECLQQEEPLTWVSQNSTIHYLAQPKGERLTAEANCIKHGHNTCLYQIVLHDEEKRLVAMVTTSGIRIN